MGHQRAVLGFGRLDDQERDSLAAVAVSNEKMVFVLPEPVTPATKTCLVSEDGAIS